MTKNKDILIMVTDGHFYPIEASGRKPLNEEAADHGNLNSHINKITDIDGNALWERMH